MTREEVRMIVAKISSYNVFTMFSVSNNQLVLNTKKGVLTDEQKKLAQKYQEEIIQYLTVEPSIDGCCLKCKLPKHWKVSVYSVWTWQCLCCEVKEEIKPVEKEKVSIADYWTRSAS